MKTERLLWLVALLAGCATGTEATPDPIEPEPDGGVAVDAAPCRNGDGGDDDGDGFDESEDCNDCDPAVNPGAYDFGGDARDDDCSGAPDDEPASCDQDIAPDTNDAWEAARALGFCRRAGDPGRSPHAWAVLDAKLVAPDGTALPDPLSHGVLSKFGVNKPREGERMLALSSGSARDPSMPGYQDILGYRKGYVTGTPAGYPKEAPACPGVLTGAAHDGAALELLVRVPTNAERIEVTENFFTVEFPGYICSKYNDYFVIDVDPKVPSYPDGNIAFDAAGNPISVNGALLQVCKPQIAGGKSYPCPLGVGELEGTGFDLVDDQFSPAPHAATGWLRTRAAVVPGSLLRIRFAIWDSADGNLDSTVLLDEIRWSKTGETGTVPIPH